MGNFISLMVYFGMAKERELVVGTTPHPQSFSPLMGEDGYMRRILKLVALRNHGASGLGTVASRVFSLWMLLFLVLLSTTVLAEDKRIVMIAGKPSHGRGEHEFRAGLLLFQKC